jgi:hypothetical protein
MVFSASPVPGVVPPHAIAAAHAAAEAAWKGTAGAPTGALIALRIPTHRMPGTPAVEVFVTAERPRAGAAVLYFAGAAPPQLYAVAAFKCSSDYTVKTADRTTQFYLISDTAADSAVSEFKTPMRPIGCDISAGNIAVTATRLHAARAVAPVATEAFFRDAE